MISKETTKVRLTKSKIKTMLIVLLEQMALISKYVVFNVTSAMKNISKDVKIFFYTEKKIWTWKFYLFSLKFNFKWNIFCSIKKNLVLMHNILKLNIHLVGLFQCINLFNLKKTFSLCNGWKNVLSIALKSRREGIDYVESFY